MKSFQVTLVKSTCLGWPVVEGLPQQELVTSGFHRSPEELAHEAFRVEKSTPLFQVALGKLEEQREP